MGLIGKEDAMANNDNLNPSTDSSKRRRSNRHKALSRSELYKDRHLANREYREQINRTADDQPIAESQRNDLIWKQEPVEQQIVIDRGKTPVRPAVQTEEEYLYDILKKKVDDAEKEEESRKKQKKIREEVAEKPEKEETIRPLYRFLIKLGIFSLTMILIFVFVLGIRINRTDRMYPYIMDGDVLITLKITSYKVGDVVVYTNPETGKNELSRIAAAGPCEVDIYYGDFMVNGKAAEKEAFYVTGWPEDSLIPNPYEVGSGNYFLLDDNRPAGEDSRLFGQIGKKDLKGKVIYIFRLRGI